MVRRSARKMSRKFHSRLEERGAMVGLVALLLAEKFTNGAALF